MGSFVTNFSKMIFYRFCFQEMTAYKKRPKGGMPVAQAPMSKKQESEDEEDEDEEEADEDDE